ncbi:unnamed protein product [Urochloa humidicola]
MAAAASGTADKENAAPSTSAAAAAVPRRHGYGVKSCGVKKRPCRARLAGPRVPLRDITNLVAAFSPVEGQDASPAAVVELAKPDVAVVPATKVRVAATTEGGAAGGAAAAKKAVAGPRYSLRKGFR